MGVWIETTYGFTPDTTTYGHTLRGCVDWNPLGRLPPLIAKSHPSWVCGLKLRFLPILQSSIWVTPFVGVWIETLSVKHIAFRILVTPFVGVWIETIILVNNRLTLRVTPFVGVWIETLKDHPYTKKTLVTPFVGVWIETYKKKKNFPKNLVTPFVGVWIETRLSQRCPLSEGCHTLRGCVDWNYYREYRKSSRAGHTLRGCVDWNFLTSIKFFTLHTSHPSWVCGLKLAIVARSWALLMSHPSWVCGLKQIQGEGTAHHSKSHPSWVCGLKQCRSAHLPLSGSHTLRGCVDWNRPSLFL